MSPVSRGRKKKRPTTRPRNARRVVPGLAGVHAELLGAFRPVVQATDPLEVEVLTSDVLGSWWKRLPPGEDPGLDIEAEVAVITTDVPAGTSVEGAEAHIALVTLVNDTSLRTVLAKELGLGRSA